MCSDCQLRAKNSHSNLASTKMKIKWYVIRMPIEMSFVSAYLHAGICTSRCVQSVKIAHVDLMRHSLPLNVTQKCRILWWFMLWLLSSKTLALFGMIHLVNMRSAHSMLRKIKCHSGIHSVDSQFIKLLHYPYHSNRVLYAASNGCAWYTNSKYQRIFMTFLLIIILCPFH